MNACGIGADAVVKRLTEGHQAGAQLQHQALRHQALGNGDGEQEHGPLRQQRTGTDHRKQNDAEDQQRAVAVHIFLGSARLNSPRGRNASTSAMTK